MLLFQLWHNLPQLYEVPVLMQEDQAMLLRTLSDQTIDRRTHSNALFASLKVDSSGSFESWFGDSHIFFG
jgi:hypothetical protein